MFKCLRIVFLLIILFISCLLVPPVFPQGNLSKSQIFKNISPGVVEVITYESEVAYRESKPSGQASGFFSASSGLLITNSHVIEKQQYLCIKTVNNEYYWAKELIINDEKNDLAVISIDIPENKVYPLPINPVLPDIGDDIVIIGCPLGFDFTLTEGIVSSIRALGENEKLIQITAPISPGSSGSPVINMKGEVIGIVIGAWDEPKSQNLNFAIPAIKIPVIKTTEELFGTTPTQMPSLTKTPLITSQLNITTEGISLIGVRYNPYDYENENRTRVVFDFGLNLPTHTLKFDQNNNRIILTFDDVILNPGIPAIFNINDNRVNFITLQKKGKRSRSSYLFEISLFLPIKPFGR